MLNQSWECVGGYLDAHLDVFIHMDLYILLCIHRFCKIVHTFISVRGMYKMLVS